MIRKAKAISLSSATLHKRPILANAFYNYGEFDNVLMISIQNSDFFPLFRNEEINSRIISLNFDDTTPKATRNFSYLLADKFMNSAQALQIVDFIDNWHRQLTNDLLLCHCHMGICRSGAVVSYTQFVCNIDGRQFTKDNPNIQPNHWVEEKLFEAFCNKHPVEKKAEGIFLHTI